MAKQELSKHIFLLTRRRALILAGAAVAESILQPVTKLQTGTKPVPSYPATFNMPISGTASARQYQDQLLQKYAADESFQKSLSESETIVTPRQVVVDLTPSSVFEAPVARLNIHKTVNGSYSVLDILTEERNPYEYLFPRGLLVDPNAGQLLIDSIEIFQAKQLFDRSLPVNLYENRVVRVTTQTPSQISGLRFMLHYFSATDSAIPSAENLRFYIFTARTLAELK